MKKIYILSFIFLMFSIKVPAQGKLCIAKLPAEDIGNEKGVDAYLHSEENKSLPKIFYVQVDKLKKVRVSETESVCVDNLSLKNKHLIKIYRGAVLKESFWLVFNKRSPKQCLWYNSFYGTWSMNGYGRCR